MPTHLSTSNTSVSHELCDLYWYKAQISRGCVTDSKGEVSIVGGDVKGPSKKGGECIWPIEIGRTSVNVAEILVIVHTNGGKFLGEGIHSTKRGGTVELYFGRTQGSHLKS